MLKRTSLSLAISLAALGASMAHAATEYYVVVPLAGKVAQLAAINVALNSYTLPEAIADSPYAGFDFKTVLAVTGDSAYNGSLVSWAVASGSLPAGLTMNADGTLSGTPTVAGTSNFTLKATYKTKTGQQAYQVVSLGLLVSMATATLPSAKVNTAYTAYDFKPLLSVAGDPSYSVSNVAFSATGVPAGMTLSNVGVLSGTPTTKNTSGAGFQVVATYKTKTGQQAYTIMVNGAPLDVTQISASEKHTCAVTTSGGAKCWGDNYYGQLGDNSTTQRLTPVDVAGLTSGVASVTAGYFHTCAVTASGGVKCWGDNGPGRLGDNSTTQRLTPVDVTGLTAGVASVTVGYYHTCAVTTSGGAKCWGYNGTGQLGDNSTTQRLTPVDVAGLTSGVASVTAGYSHTCAVTTSGGAKCWGNDYYGQLGDNSTTTRLAPVDVSGLTAGVSSVTAGYYHTCAVTTSGGAKCWGRNGAGQLGDNSTTTRLAPVDVSGLTAGVSSVTAGYYHTCAVTASGGVKCWGSNGTGRLGDNSTTNRNTPVDVVGLTSGVASVTAGYYHTCAVTTSGGAKCWGENGAGQLGDNSTTQRLTPVDVVN